MDLTMSNIRLGWFRLAAVTVATAVLLSGCVSTQQTSASPYHDYSALNYLPGNLSQQLNGAQAGSELHTEQSPWGASASILIVERYFAASGRQCLKLRVNGGTSLHTACRYEQQWVLTPELVPTVNQG